MAVPAAALALLLAASEARPGPSDAARAELDACAVRIERLKARHEGGRELERLLRRAQELAAQLEGTPEAGRAAPAALAADEAPSAEELRERADAARDDADRLTAEIAELDVRIGDLRRSRPEPGGAVERAALGAAPAAPGEHRIRTLLAERAALVERRIRAMADAARLDADARAAERDR